MRLARSRRPAGAPYEARMELIVSGLHPRGAAHASQSLIQTNRPQVPPHAAGKSTGVKQWRW